MDLPGIFHSLALKRRIKTKTLNDILNEDTEPEDHHGKGAEPRQ